MSTPADPPKALSYVPQIKAAYAELLATNESKLACAVRLGALLNDAKDALGKKGNWMEFRAAHFREISHSTANVYMQLAKHKDKLGDPANSQRAVNSLVEKDLSIRGAIEAMNNSLKTPQERAQADAEKKRKEAEREAAKIAKAEAVERAKAMAETDPATVLEALDPSEVLDAITDKDKKAELLKQQLRELHPYRLLDLLTEAWANDTEFLPQLGEAIGQRLKTNPVQVKRRQLPGEAAQPAA
jgi:hypothetical protein